jgi:hypothetical protein
MRIGANPESWRGIGAGTRAGVEIELRHPDGWSGVFEAISDNPPPRELEDYLAAAKVDGSVVGGEFVTQPASLREHRRLLPTAMAYLRSLGLFADSSCGLHVHVERKPGEGPGTLLEDKVAAIGNFSTPAWDECFRIVSGRRGARWARTVAEREGTPFYYALVAVQRYRSQLSSEKYLRVNLQHAATFEFRQGHGTAHAGRALLRIEFAVALVEFLRRKSTDELQRIGAPAEELALFLAWCCEHPLRYPKLSRLSSELLQVTANTL